MTKEIFKEQLEKQLDKIYDILSNNEKEEKTDDKNVEDILNEEKERREKEKIGHFKQLMLHYNTMFEFGIDFDKFTETDWYMLGCLFFENLDKPHESLIAVTMKVAKAIVFANKLIEEIKKEGK